METAHVTKKPDEVQNWENEGGALPEPVFWRAAQRGLFERLADRVHEARRRVAISVARNPEFALGAAIGLGVLFGANSRRLSLLKLVFGTVAKAKRLGW